MVVERECRVIASLYVSANIADKPVECLRVVHKLAREFELKRFRIVAVVFDHDGDFAFCEHVVAAVAQLKRVPKVYGSVDVAHGGVPDGGHYGKRPRRARKVNRDGMDVDPHNRTMQPAEHLIRRNPCRSRMRDIMPRRLYDESAAAAGRIQYALLKRIRHKLRHHSARQPFGGVVFAERASFVRRYDALVQYGRDVVGEAALPVKSTNSLRQRLDECLPADLRRPNEKVRFHYALQPRLAAKLLPRQQVVGIRGGERIHLNPEYRLHHYPDNRREIGMPHKQVVLLRQFIRHFAKRGAQQVVPQIALNPNCFGILEPIVQPR